MEEKKPPKKYQRREFIKTSAKVGAGTALWGAAGYGIGRGYKWGRDEYQENVKPYADKGKEAIDKVGGTKDRLGNWWDKYFNKKKYEKERQEELERGNQAQEAGKMSRRGFFSKYFHIFNEHPVAIGTITGVALGGLINSLKLYPQYIEKKKVAKLRDENINYEKRLKILEEYKENLEKVSGEKDQKIKGLEDEVEKLRKIYEKLNMSEKDSSGLEEKIESNELKNTLSMLLCGISLIIAFILINGVDYTGFSVLSKDYISTSDFLGVIVIFTSLALIVIGGLRLRKINKKQP